MEDYSDERVRRVSVSADDNDDAQLFVLDTHDPKWFQDKRFHFFWHNYNSVFESWLDPTRQIFAKHAQLLNISRQASAAAHLAAMTALEQFDMIKTSQLSTSVPAMPKKPPRRKEPMNKFEFEISSDLIKFYEQSFQYKKEKKEQEKMKLRQIKSENIGNILVGNAGDLNLNTVNAPLQQAGQRREDELRVLYGKRAHAIHLAETSMQMRFDKNLDRYQPKYWPFLPLRL